MERIIGELKEIMNAFNVCYGVWYVGRVFWILDMGFILIELYNSNINKNKFLKLS